MLDLTVLPRAFRDLPGHIPADFQLSDRVLDAEILIDRQAEGIVARLVGTRMVRGARQVFFAPSVFHAWVIDGSTFRPLPVDASEAFLQVLGQCDPANLSYSQAVALLNAKSDIAVQATGRFLASGRVAADDLPDTMEVPGLVASLFPYQARGIRWMHETVARTGGLILADEMGLGKTLQIIALFLIDIPPIDAPALVVCPTSLIANWVREIDKFAPSLSVMIHRGPHRTGIYRGLQRANVVVTTYDTMVNDIAIFSAFEWSWVICDEAQAIKNPDSNRRKAIGTIPRRSTIPMTGTPVENSLLDLWSLTDFAIPGLLGTRRDFERSYPDTFDSAKVLNSITDPIILKRRVSDVAGDLPERIDVDFPLELDEQLAEHYREVREQTVARYPVAGALVATLELQLVCAHPWLRLADPRDVDGEFAEIDCAENMPLMTSKMERVISLLSEAFANGRKVIVFALFNRLGGLIREAGMGLPEAFWGAINGSTPQSDRQDIIDRFTKHDGPGCLILNPKAAGAGLNITAATVVIHFTPVWNPALEAQASARAYRRGQTLPVTIYRLYYEDTVERVMLDRSKWKQELGNEIMPVSTRDGDDIRRALSIEPVKV